MPSYTARSEVLSQGLSSSLPPNASVTEWSPAGKDGRRAFDLYPTGKSGGNRVGCGLDVRRGVRPATETLDPGLVYSEYSE